LIFNDDEDVLTHGALIAPEMFRQSLPVLRLSAEAFRAPSAAKSARIDATSITAEDLIIPITPPGLAALDLTPADSAMLERNSGDAVQQVLRMFCAMAAEQGATRLTCVTQAHIDGCIYASPANLTIAEKMADMGASVCVPTTMNAISVDRASGQAQGVSPSFGLPAAPLASVYLDGPRKARRIVHVDLPDGIVNAFFGR